MPDTSSPAFALAVGVMVAVALFAGTTGRLLSQVITLVHELGHAAAGLVVGGKVKRVSIALDASGETLTLIGGRLPRLRLAVFASAGYPAPGFAGLVAAWAVAGDDHRVFLLVAAVVVGVSLVLWVRNLWGIVVFVVTAGLLWSAAAYGDDALTRTATIALAWLFGAGGARSTWQLAARRARATGGLNDAQRVAQLSGLLPTGLVAAGFLAVSVACLALSAVLLVRPD